MADEPVQDLRLSFGERLRRLRLEAGMTLEDLGFEARTQGPAKVTFSYVGQLERGLKHPSAHMIETLANGLGIEPAVFPEYRLAKLRELFDERLVGLEQAVENARELAAVLSEADGLPAEPPGELERLLRIASPAAQKPGRSRPARRRRAKNGRSS